MASQGQSPTQRADRLPDQVYDLLRRSIDGGEFAAGAKLPPESELARRYGVSRPTVRQAMFRLRLDGRLTSRRGAGSYVTAGAVPAAGRPASIESIADIDHYYVFRACVEAGAAAQAAQMRSADDLAAIRLALARLAEAMDAGASEVEHDVAFHLAVARASHNPFFVSTIEDSVGPVRQCMEVARSLLVRKNRDRDRQVQAEHRAVVDAVERASPADAAEAMRHHMTQARRRIFEGSPR